MEKADKLKILARLFFQDNEDQYEDYRAAEIEFMTQTPSDSFIEFTLGHTLKPKEGHELVYSPVGHVAYVRDSDGFLEPVTEMSQEDGMELETEFEEAAGKYLDLDGMDLLLKTSWKKVEFE